MGSLQDTGLAKAQAESKPSMQGNNVNLVALQLVTSNLGPFVSKGFNFSSVAD